MRPFVSYATETKNFYDCRTFGRHAWRDAHVLRHEFIINPNLNMRFWLESESYYVKIGPN